MSLNFSISALKSRWKDRAEKPRLKDCGLSRMTPKFVLISQTKTRLLISNRCYRELIRGASSG